MKLLRKLSIVTLFLTGFIFSTGSLHAQRNVSYQELVKQSQQRGVTVDRIVLPGKSPSTVDMVNIFSLPYSVLPFRKSTSEMAGGKFFSAAELSLEVFKSDKSRLNSKKDVSVKGLESITRSFWSDTAYAKNFEESQSPEHFLNGSLEADLQPGIYSYILQLRRGEETNSRISKVRTVSLKSFDDINVGDVIVGSNIADENGFLKMALPSLGKNVRYGKNFYALIHLPGYEPSNKYSLTVKSLNATEKDTSIITTNYTKELATDDIYTGIRPEIVSGNGTNTSIALTPSENGYAYVLLEIPGKKLPNSHYLLTVTESNSKKPVARGTFRSIWVNMPASLYSLDVAIDMLKFITDKKTLDRLQTGTQKQREKKFREFWEKRDPTPNSEYNELMAEYYQRIDYAYNHFSTDNVLGFNSDQGEVYIKYGEPNNIERKFPTNSPTLEIWTYKNKTFVFEATSGFGDFKLVSQKSN